MSAIRYCGDLRIRITYVDEAAWAKGEPAYYRCAITCNRLGQAGRSRIATIDVTPPTFETCARDSSEAFDSVAHASLSFAYDEGWPVSEHACQNEEGWDIRRKN